MFKRPPDRIIGEDKNDPYMRRWYIIPRNKYLNVYLHHFLKSDEDRALHDHPWWSIGVILKGHYYEVTPKNQKKWIEEGERIEVSKRVNAGELKYRGSKYIHRIKLPHDVMTGKPVPVWTLFITGPRVRDWGFWCPFGFRRQEDFLDKTGDRKGRGCD